MSSPADHRPPSLPSHNKISEMLVGKPRDLKDPHIFQHVSLVAFLAWVGLGADGLSSSAYGPDEAYRALGIHTHLALMLVVMTAITIIVISVAYSDLIEHFPGGGGGYLVASKLLGPRVGVISGCALLVDYMLTISVSIASGCDALWSFLPPHLLPYKMTAEFAMLAVLVVINLRGVKESVTMLAPIFVVFLITHVILIGYAIISHLAGIPMIFHGAATDFRASVHDLGILPIALVLLRAYSMGGGTYTGIEAVSNGVPMLREPRVATGKKTMFLMAASLTVTAGGILFGYMLTNAHPMPGKTMNAVLLESLFNTWTVGGWSIGSAFVIVTLIAEAALLFVAAQAGFLDGPRILANMALDSWMPHRFAHLSNRLVTKNGIFLMALAAAGTLFYTHGNISTLVVMYSINVFLTFTLTELGMVRHWIADRAKEAKWRRKLAVHGTGLLMCVSILCITLYEKFAEGGWVTSVITASFVTAAFLIHRHYTNVNKGFKQLDDVLQMTTLDLDGQNASPIDKKAATAILAVPRYSGYGIHHFLAITKLFKNHFKNIVFVSVGVIDSGNFKGAEEMTRMEAELMTDLKKYMAWCRQYKVNADYRMEIATEAIPAVEKICRDLAKEYPDSIVFTGKLIFRKERWYQRLLHSETALGLQRRLQLDGIPTIILPIRA